MKVKEVMSKKVITVKTTDTLEKVAGVLFKNQVSGVLVLDPKGQLVGIISEKDVYKMMYPTNKDFQNNPEIFLDHEAMEDKIDEVRGIKAEEFMKREIIILSPDDPVMKAGAVMLARNVNRLPVVDQGEILGIVSRRDIYQNIFKQKLGLK